MSRYELSATNLLIQLDISENGMDPPGLGEHGTEGEAESCHKEPGSSGTDVGKCSCGFIDQDIIERLLFVCDM